MYLLLVKLLALGHQMHTNQCDYSTLIRAVNHPHLPLGSATCRSDNTCVTAAASHQLLSH